MELLICLALIPAALIGLGVVSLAVAILTPIALAGLFVLLRTAQFAVFATVWLGIPGAAIYLAWVGWHAALSWLAGA